MAKKTISVYDDTYEKLGKLKQRGETFDRVLNRLLSFYEKEVEDE